MYSLGPCTCPTLWRWLHLCTSPTRMLLKQIDAYLRAWWSPVRSIMASAGDCGMVWCHGWRAARWCTPGCSPFFPLSCHFFVHRVDRFKSVQNRGRQEGGWVGGVLISALFSNFSALWEEKAADETPGWRRPKPVSRHKEKNVVPLCFNNNVSGRMSDQQKCLRFQERVWCLHTTDISCTLALIMNRCVFGWTFKNKVGSLLSFPVYDTPAASRVK